MAHCAMVRREQLAGGEVRCRWLWMKGVVVHWIDNALDSRWRVDTDHGVVDGVRNCGVESPVPVWDSERCCGCLVLRLLRWGVGTCDLLGIGPK